MSPVELVQQIENKILSLNDEEDQHGQSFRDRRRKLLETMLSTTEEALRRRIIEEFEGWGPLEELSQRRDLTEVLLNAPDSVWIERGGRLERCAEGFLSKANYERIIERLSLDAGSHASLERPFADGTWRGFRVHIGRPPATKEFSSLCLRRHPDNPWTLTTLQESGWCTPDQASLLRELVARRWNFLVIGATGAGKTSVVNALLAECGSDRAAVLEDNDEIAVPKGPSLKILTRKDAQGLLPEVTLSDLVRQALRMRPDRVVVGEVRGGEAKDFLMALSTGHAGSFGTLHAESAAQALLRLEMLIQMGAPAWGLETVRRLVRLSLQAIVVTGRNERGERQFKGLHRIVSLEESGFVLEPLEFIPRRE